MFDAVVPCNYLIDGVFADMWDYCLLKNDMLVLSLPDLYVITCLWKKKRAPQLGGGGWGCCNVNFELMKLFI